MSAVWGYLAVGALIGFLSGLYGVGGSGLSTPTLKLLFPLPDLVALASPLPVTIPTALAGAYSYWRRGLVRREVLLWTTVGGLPGVILGALGTRVIAVSWLMGLTGLFVVVIGLRLLKRGELGAPPASAWSGRKTVIALGIGVVVGVLSGLLANGGGFLLVPAFILLLGLTMTEAAATSLVCVALFAVPGTLVHWWLGHIDWVLVAALSVGVMPASYLGSRVGLAVGGPRLQTAFGLFLVVFGVAFALSQLGAPTWASDAALFASFAIGIAAVVFGDAIARLRSGAPTSP
jgi:uncharacterized membrane protein YfcA